MSSRNITDSLRSKLRRTPAAIESENRASFVKLDLSARVDTASLVSFPRPHQTTVDVIPDTRFILLAISDGVTRAFASGNFRDNAYVTPASVTGYCLILLYGFMLIADSCYRSTPSPFAEQILHMSIVQDFIDIIANAAVPDFFVPILNGLLPHTDSILTHLDFVPTLACYFFNLDYGRVIPASVFIAAHNTVSENPANAHPTATLDYWYHTVLLNIRTGSNAVITVNEHILGILRSGTNTVQAQDSWLTNAINSLINPVTSRFHAGRPTFSRIPFTHETITNWNQFNPYLYCLGLNGRNATGYFHYVRHMSEYCKSSLNGGLTLFHITDSSSNQAIVSHLISGPSYPTSHISTIAASASPTRPALPNTPTYGTADVTARQATIHFLVPPNQANSGSAAIRYPTAITPMVQANADVFLRVENEEIPEVADRTHPIEFVNYDSTRHVTGNMLIYNALALTPSAMFSCLVTGLIIENGSVDGFAIHVPNPDMAPSDNNATSIFASAVNASNVFNNVEITNSTTRISVPTRPVHRWPTVPNAILNRNMTEVILPRIYRSLNQGTTFTLHNIGLRPVDRFPSLYFAQSFLGRVTSSVPEHTAENARLIYLWSSYRILEDERHEFSISQTDRITTTRFSLLTSLKNVFGARSLVGSISHPAAIIH